MKLYELIDLGYEIENMLEQDEISIEEYEMYKGEFMNQLTKKSENVIHYMNNLDAEITKNKDASELYLDNIKRLKKKKENMKKLMLMTMQQLNQQKIATPYGTISVRDSPGSLKINDMNLIPQDYKVLDFVEVIPSEQKEKIKKMLKDGNAVPGAELEISTSVYISKK